MSPTLSAIAASAALGALIGLIRQWSDQIEHPDDSEPDFGGVRTHCLWGMLGCLGGSLSGAVPWALPVILLVVGAQQILARWRSVGEGHVGGTGFATMLLTVLVGTLVAWQATEAAALMTGLTIVVLGVKKPLHDWTHNFTADDVRAALQFIAITGVVLPLVPNQAIGPFNGFNPYSTWLMVVLISGVGFAGYVAMRVLGTKSGIIVTSLLGGVASSTATTLAFSRRSKEDPERSVDYAFAIAAACTIMVPRVLAVIAVLNPALAMGAALPLALMTLPALVFAGWYLLRPSGKGEVQSPAVSNPLSLKTSIKFALLYAVFAFMVKASTALEMQSSLLPLSFVSGLTDMDAIALSMAETQRDGSVALDLAVKAVVVAAVANSILKATMAISLGSKGLRLPVMLVLGGAAGIGGVAVLLS